MISIGGKEQASEYSPMIITKEEMADVNKRAELVKALKDNLAIGSEGLKVQEFTAAGLNELGKQQGGDQHALSNKVER